MILLGLTGNPASGKSTVAKRLQEKGAVWINADLIARDVLNLPATTDVLAKHFGDAILSDDGKVNRKTLAGLVFGDTPDKKAALDYLESVLHPPTRIEITDRLRAAASTDVHVAILDVPLLFESKWDLSCDTIWCIDAPVQSRLDWSKKRGWDAAELQRRESNQKEIGEKRRLSNLFLLNDGPLADLRKKVDSQWEILVTMEEVRNDSPHCLTDS